MTGLAAAGGSGRSYALLADGTTLTVRPTRPEDYQAVKQSHEAMSPENLYFRFFTASRVSAELEARRVCRDDRPGMMALLGLLDGELAVVTVPAARVVQAAEECGDRGVRALAVITAGLTWRRKPACWRPPAAAACGLLARPRPASRCRKSGWQPPRPHTTRPPVTSAWPSSPAGSARRCSSSSGGWASGSPSGVWRNYCLRYSVGRRSAGHRPRRRLCRFLFGSLDGCLLMCRRCRVPVSRRGLPLIGQVPPYPRRLFPHPGQSSGILVSCSGIQPASQGQVALPPGLVPRIRRMVATPLGPRLPPGLFPADRPLRSGPSSLKTRFLPAEC